MLYSTINTIKPKTMRKLSKIIILLGLTLFMAFSCDDDDSVSPEKKFYYASSGDKIYLIPVENTLIVKYVEGVEQNSEEMFLNNSSPGVSVIWIDLVTAEIKTVSEELKNSLMLILKQKEEVYTCQTLYTTEDGLKMGVTDEILMKFYPNISIDKQDSIHKIYNTSFIKETNIYQKFRVSKGDDALEIANKYYESGLVEFSEPNFLSEVEFY